MSLPFAFEVSTHERPLRRRVHGGALALLVTAALAACGGDDKEKPASQVAAKVNKEELSVHQINFVLAQQRGLRAEQADAASRQVLERLVDQEVALQKAGELRIDRDPRVVQQLEAARREIIARAYTEKVGEGATKPTADEITAYYNEKPALFKERRVYSLQEIAIDAKPEQLDALKKALGEAKNVTEFIEFLKSNDYRFGANQAVRAAEQLPLANLDTFAKMKDGDTLFNTTPTGAQVILLVGSRSQPIDEQRARPAIEQFLINDRKRRLIEDDIKALRKTAKIEYVGKFAESAASAAERAQREAAAAPPPAPPKPAYVPQASPQLPAASELDTGAVNSGMGLKESAGGSASAAPTASPEAAASGALDVNSINSGMGLKK